jgi:hypothetical protein
MWDGGRTTDHCFELALEQQLVEAGEGWIFVAGHYDLQVVVGMVDWGDGGVGRRRWGGAVGGVERMG